jgi:hypothetical protein
MNAVLWVLQILLAVAFFAHGGLLLFPPAAMLEQMRAAGMVDAFRLFLGVAEIVAAIGLTLPGITRIQPWWTQYAAVGIMIVMVSATVFHLARGEVSSAITTSVLLGMATFVAYMRWKVLPIRARAAA